MTDQPSPNPKMQIPTHSAGLFRLKAAPRNEVSSSLYPPPSSAMTSRPSQLGDFRPSTGLPGYIAQLQLTLCLLNI